MKLCQTLAEIYTTVVIVVASNVLEGHGGAPHGRVCCSWGISLL